MVISAGLGANNGPDEQLRTNSSDSPTPSKKSKLSDCKVNQLLSNLKFLQSLEDT